MRSFLFAFALFPLFGCDGLFEDQPDYGAPFVGDAGPPAQVAGRWTLTGSGRMRACDDERYNSEDLSLSTELLIGQDGSQLFLAEQPPGGQFTLENGIVRESRVFITTVEQVANTRIRLRFDGLFDPLLLTLYGAFQGEGPGTCVSNGRFEGTVTP